MSCVWVLKLFTPPPNPPPFKGELFTFELFNLLKTVNIKFVYI